MSSNGLSEQAFHRLYEEALLIEGSTGPAEGLSRRTAIRAIKAALTTPPVPVEQGDVERVARAIEIETIRLQSEGKYVVTGYNDSLAFARAAIAALSRPTSMEKLREALELGIEYAVECANNAGDEAVRAIAARDCRTIEQALAALDSISSPDGPQPMEQKS